MEIESESQFVWKQIKFLLKLPFILLLVLFGKREKKELLAPLRDLWNFLLEPKATVVLIVLNVIVFILQMFYFGDIDPYVFTLNHLLKLNFFPMVASWFLHANLSHLLGNMLALYIFGRVVERRFGPWYFLLIYFGAGIIASLLSVLFGQPGIGASGAISGVISTAIMIDPFYFTYLILGIPLPIMLIGLLSIWSDLSNIIVPANDNIGHFAHLGGYLSTALIVFMFSEEKKHKMKIGLIINVVFVALAVILYYFVF